MDGWMYGLTNQHSVLQSRVNTTGKKNKRCDEKKKRAENNTIERGKPRVEWIGKGVFLVMTTIAFIPMERVLSMNTVS